MTRSLLTLLFPDKQISSGNWIDMSTRIATWNYAGADPDFAYPRITYSS